MITGGSLKASHNVFLDTNVFGKLMTSTFDPLDFIVNTLKSVGENNVRAVNVITSPFALFEYLGISVPKPPDLIITHKEFFNTPAPKIVSKAMSYADEFYKNKKNLDLNKLNIRTEEMRKFISHEAHTLLDGIVKPFTKPDRIEIVRQALAWDFAMNLQIPSSIQKSYYKGVMTGLGYFHTTGTNYTFSKPAAECMKHIIKEYLKENKNDDAAIKARASLSFKKNGDHLDRELLHFSLVGWHYNTGMPLRTHCLTADPETEIKIRIQNIGMIYAHYYDNWWIKHWQNDLGKVAAALPGFIHCLDFGSLAVTKSFDCSEFFVLAK